MALIKCTECGKEFSDRAAACPNCGCPTDIILEDIEKEKSIQQKRLLLLTILEIINLRLILKWTIGFV